MRIAIVHPAFGAWGGAENVVLWLCRSLVARGHGVTVLSGAFSEPAREWLSAAGAEIRLLRFMHGRPWERVQVSFPKGRPRVRMMPLADHVVRLDRGAMRRGAAALARTLRGFDAVNVHNFPGTWWVAAALEEGDLPPVAWSCNEPPRTLYPGLFDGDAAEIRWPEESELVRHDRAVGGRFSAIFCLSEYVRRRVAAIYERPDAVSLGLGIPLARPGGTVPRRATGGDFLMVTRLVPAKNVETVLRALALMPEARLRIVGDGPDGGRLRALADDLGLGDRARFLGFVDDAALQEEYRQAAALVYLPIGEPFGLALVEAGAAGLPCVTSNHGGPAEIVRDGETGALVDPRSPDEVARGMREVLQAPHLGEQAWRVVQEHYSFERYVDRYLEGLRGNG